MDWLRTVQTAIRDADRNGLLVNSEILSGFSGLKVIGLLQRVARSIESLPNTCYAEIGVFQGLTLLSVASVAPKLKTYGIDNYSQFDPEHRNKQLVLERQERLSLRNVALIDLDYDEALRRFQELSTGERIGLLFVDGPHDYRSQLLCVLLALPHLAENAVIVVDDCNYEHVRLATRDLLMIDSTMKLVFQAYTSGHPMNVGPEKEREMRRGWWNGVHVLLRGPTAADVQGLYPETGQARKRCEREHMLHSHGVEAHGQELYDLAYALAVAPNAGRLREAWKLARCMRGKILKDALFLIGNTYSATLASESLLTSRDED
jgi:hypothetical protein